MPRPPASSGRIIGGMVRAPYMPRDAPPAIAVRPVGPALADAVRALQLAPAQRDYVGDTAFNL